MFGTLRRHMPTSLPFCILTAAVLGCRGDRDQSAGELADSATTDTTSLGATDSVEIAFVRWWRAHANNVALRQNQPEAQPQISNRIIFKLAGADTLATGDTEVQILDLVRQNATLPNAPGTFRVFEFPEWERQLRLWVPEDGPDCAQQQAALTIGGGEPTRLDLNPFCQSANLPYDVDGVAITAYFPHPEGAAWIEFAYDVSPCAPVQLFRWSPVLENVQLVQTIQECPQPIR